MFDIHEYSLIQKIGSGSFGSVYKAKNRINGQQVAIKLEPRDAHQQLHLEYKVLNVLCQGYGVPQVIEIFKTNRHNVLVMELLGPSLEELFQYCKRLFSLKTILMLAIQMINRVECMHKNNFLHCDIKPANFVTGATIADRLVYIIDFGLAKEYIKNKEHIPLLLGRNLTGTVRYASVNVTNGIQISRRDDLESLAYCLIYFLRGSLPWQNLTGTKQQRLEKIAEMKQSIHPEELCKGYPNEFAAFLIYCRSISFEQTPDYEMLRLSLIKVFNRMKYVNDNMFDWHLLKKPIKVEEEESDESSDEEENYDDMETNDDEENKDEGENNNAEKTLCDEETLHGEQPINDEKPLRDGENNEISN